MTQEAGAGRSFGWHVISFEDHAGEKQHRRPFRSRVKQQVNQQGVIPKESFKRMWTA